MRIFTISINKKVLLTTLLIIFNSCSGALASGIPNFEEVFNTTIYDQVTTLVRLVPMDYIMSDTPEATTALKVATLETRRDIIQRHIPQGEHSLESWEKIINLYQIKYELVHQKILRQLIENIRHYETIRVGLQEEKGQRAGVEVERARRLVDTKTGGFQHLARYFNTVDVTKPLSLLSFLTVKSNAAAEAEAVIIDGDASSQMALLSGNDSELRKLIQEKSMEVDKIERSIFEEPIRDHEITYIVRKSDLLAYDRKLCDQIEMAFLGRRKKVIPDLFIDEFLGKRLSEILC